jgi:DNA-binding transcriptional ArsR family regulator
MISRKNILHLKIRQDIYEAISKYPGIHLSELSRKLNIPKTTLKHHLKYLDKASLIDIKKQNSYMRFFIRYKAGKKEREILNLLRQETPRHIIFYMLNNSVSSQIELSKELDKNPAAIYFHLKKLKEIGLINHANTMGKNEINLGDSYVLKRDKLGNEVVYGFSKGEFFPFIYNLLIAHKDSLPDKHLIVEVISMLEEGYRGSIFKEINSQSKAIDTLIDSVYEIFPHPYHA